MYDNEPLNVTIQSILVTQGSRLVRGVEAVAVAEVGLIKCCVLTIMITTMMRPHRCPGKLVRRFYCQEHTPIIFRLCLSVVSLKMCRAYRIKRGEHICFTNYKIGVNCKKHVF